MKRYQLKNKYPGSPKLGTIVYHPHKNNFGGVENDYKMKNDRNTINWIFYNKDYIEDYPKFWQKL